MSRIEYGGSHFNSMRNAAARWAVDALPDTNVVGREEDAEDVADSLEVYWWNEAARAGHGAPEGVDADDWRAACRKALAERIERSRE